MEKMEGLTPLEADFSEILTQIDRHLSVFQDFINQKKRKLRSYPAGRLRAGKCHGKVQYYHIIDGKGKNGVYIRKKAFEMAEQLAQKEYDVVLLKHLEKNVRVLQSARRNLKNHAPLQVIQKFSELKTRLITPATLPDQEYAAQWKSRPYETRPFTANGPQFFTALGEQVRSKSEILIADTLTRLGIPYRYEFPLQLTVGLGDQRVFHPDFTCLNLRTRREFVWEHFGLMDDMEYSAKCVDKIHIFERNGLFAGDRFIFTMETSDQPLDTKSVERLAKKWLL